jgi:hypothetical protein
MFDVHFLDNPSLETIQGQSFFSIELVASAIRGSAKK